MQLEGGGRVAHRNGGITFCWVAAVGSPVPARAHRKVAMPGNGMALATALRLTHVPRNQRIWYSINRTSRDRWENEMRF